MVLTPPLTADYMVSRLEPILSNQVILDPCVGPGIFVKSLINRGAKNTQICAFDLNPNYIDFLKKYNIQFEQRDTLLTINPGSYSKFDFIVGNPPYLNKASEYIKRNRTKLQKIYGHINAHETYAMFLVNSIWRLKEGGKLCFITSDSFLTLKTHFKLRKFILRTCKIKEILLAPKNLFDNQNVSTNPAIILLEKCSGKEKSKERLENVMKIIPRVKNEEEYYNLKRVHQFKQGRYYSLPFNIFFIDVEKEVIEFFEKASKLQNYLKGYIGMHTHDNRKYIAAVEESPLSGMFKKRNEKLENYKEKFKIVTKSKLNSENWKPYLKRGGSDQYYREVMEALRWDEDSIKIYDIPANVPFEREGIVISGVSSRLAVRYMPSGCYWDSNKAIGFVVDDSRFSIEYFLGLLNSSLYNYLAKGIINNTNSIQITGIHALPIVLPDSEVKGSIEHEVKAIVSNLKKDPKYDYSKEQKVIDKLVFDFHKQKFNFPENLWIKIEKNYSYSS